MRYDTVRYRIAPAEKLRRGLGMSESQFSVHLGFSPYAYEKARARGGLSHLMVQMIALRHPDIKLSSWPRVKGRDGQ